MKKLIGTAVAATMLAAALAHAQGPGERPGRGGGDRPGFGPPRGEFGPRHGIGPGEGPEGRPMPPRPPPMFGLLDRNHDGVLDDVEIREAPDALRKLDRDGDGKVSIREAFGPLDRQPGRPEFEPRPRHGEGDQPEPGDRPRGPREGDERGERRGPRGEGPRPSRPPSQ